MKKTFTLLFTVFLLGTTLSHAGIVVITVTNFQFSPSNPTVFVGDVVRFQFNQGFHNVVQTGLANPGPSGAAEINSGAAASTVRAYDYTVTVGGIYNFYCAIHAGPTTTAATGMANSFTASSPVPVDFKGLTVKANQQGKAQLNWETLSEQNVGYFSVRKSTNAFDYTEIARVNAVGNSNTLQAYTYTDNSILPKEKYVYYNLKIVDKDGKEKITEVKTFKNPNAINQLIVSLSPNPISRPGQLMTQFNAEKNGAMAVKVFDAAGKMVLQTSLAAFTGLNNGHIHVCDLAPGTYNLSFEMDGLKETKRIVVQ